MFDYIKKNLLIIVLIVALFYMSILIGEANERSKNALNLADDNNYRIIKVQNQIADLEGRVDYLEW